MSFFSNPIKKIQNQVEQTVTQVKNTVEESLPKVNKPATEVVEILKNVAQEAADFAMNSDSRAYWDKEISSLRGRFEELKKEYYAKREQYNQVRIKYSEKFSTYNSLRNSMPEEGGERLGLTFMPNSQSMADPKDFDLDTDVREEVIRFTLSLASGGISNIFFASQEAEQEANHWRKQNSMLEKFIEQLCSGIAKHEETIGQLDQAINDILQLYGSGTTIENFIQRVCAFLAKQSAQETLIRIVRNMQVRGESQEMIQEVTSLSDAELAQLGFVNHFL
jgi:hypothetical protein